MHADVRTAEPGDLPLLAGIEEAGDELLLWALGATVPFGPATPGEFRDREPGFLLVGGRPPIGFAHVLEEDGSAHLQQLVVHPDHGRQGVGRALIEEACGRARAAGYGEITLTTYADVPFNAPFYAAAGFVEVARPSGVLARHLDRESDAALLGRRVGMVRALGPDDDPDDDGGPGPTGEAGP